MSLPKGYRIEHGFAVPPNMKFGDYYIRHSKSLDNAFPLLKSSRTALQAGGHLGAYPRKLATVFKKVITFEPNHKAWKALEYNCKDFPIEVHTCALSDGMKTQTTAMNNDEYVMSPTMAIDELGLVDLDMLCLDVEGNEYDVLRGASLTFTHNSPVVVMEEALAPRTPLAWVELYGNACKWLIDRGYKLVLTARCGPDRIWVKG